MSIRRSIIKLGLTDFWHAASDFHINRNALFRILNSNFNVELCERPDYLIYSCFGSNHLNYDCIKIFYTGENKRPNFQECDYAFSFDYPIDSRNYRLPLYRLEPEYDLLIKPRSVDYEQFKHRKFCCFLYSNPGPQERLAFFHLISRYKKVDSGGTVSNNIGRKIDDQLDFYNQYKFCIAFENSTHPGYTTEKLSQALAANTIPIYWGNTEVSEDFNEKAFINCHKFTSFDSVVHLVQMIDQSEELQHSYLAEPYLPGGVETFSCREENIVERFEKIFSSKRPYISPARKRLQRFWNALRQLKTRLKL